MVLMQGLSSLVSAGCCLQYLPDLHLQVSIGLLQGAHLVQVGSQTVTEVLHGHLLIIAQQCVLWPMKLLLESP